MKIRINPKFLNKKVIIISSLLIILLIGSFSIGRAINNRANKDNSLVKSNELQTEAPEQISEPIVPSPSATPTSTPTPTPSPTESSTEATEPVVADTPAPVANNSSAPSYSGAFQWGVTMRPNVLGKYSSKTWTKQIEKANDLGVKWARINWDYDNSDPATRNASVVEDLESNNMNTLLVIEHNPNKGNSNLYQQGLDDASLITNTLKSKVNYYQLANEGGAQSIISGKSGVSKSDYDNTRYDQVRDYIKGLSDGIAQGDPGATRIVTISWTHTGFLDRLVSDGVNFDMVGIDWYSWMGSFSAKKINDTDTVFQKLKTFGKPLSFMEESTLPTASDADGKYKTIVDEDKQADFLTSTANWAWANKDWVKGFYHFELVDNTFSSGYTDYYGLIKVIKDDSTATLGDVRKAFNSYHDLIAGK